jgi:type I restriction enzyme S subunit
MSSLVPEGWSRKKLGDSLIPRPKSKLPSGESNPLGYYDFYVCSHKVLKSFHNEYSSPSILFSTGGEASVHLATERYAFSTDVWATEFEGDICNDYVFRLLEENIRTINYSGFQGSGIKHLDKSFIEKLEFSIPPLPEQKKIASILTSVDEVIESTQKQIDKLQDLKKATMNELLTKGIGHTEFKDSELGRIPKSWSISNIEKLTQFVTSGSRGWSQYYSSEGSLFIRIGNLTRDHINLKFADIQLVEPPSGGEGTRTKVKVGDILVSITADLGVIGIVNESLGEAYVNQHVCLVRLESVSDVNPRWVGHFLSGHAGQEQFEKKNDGGAKAGLNLPTIRSIVVPLPSPQEQNKVVRVLDRLDSEISIKQTKLAKHQSLKKSLMQDLLTGKVRVTVN